MKLHCSLPGDNLDGGVAYQQGAQRVHERGRQGDTETSVPPALKIHKKHTTKHYARAKTYEILLGKTMEKEPLLSGITPKRGGEGTLFSPFSLNPLCGVLGDLGNA